MGAKALTVTASKTHHSTGRHVDAPAVTDGERLVVVLIILGIEGSVGLLEMSAVRVDVNPRLVGHLDGEGNGVGQAGHVRKVEPGKRLRLSTRSREVKMAMR